MHLPWIYWVLIPRFLARPKLHRCFGTGHDILFMLRVAAALMVTIMINGKSETFSISFWALWWPSSDK